MNNLKSKAGFTLVELIVVIAILAILAGVGTAAYSGYISKANDAAALTELDAMVTAAQAANATKGGVSKITVVGTTVTVEATTFADNFNADFVTFYGSGKIAATTGAGAGNGKLTLTSDVLANTSYATAGAEWSANKWSAK